MLVFVADRDEIDLAIQVQRPVTRIYYRPHRSILLIPIGHRIGLDTPRRINSEEKFGASNRD